VCFASTQSRHARAALTANDRAILFDFGGTLDADGLPWKERVYRLFSDEGAVIARDRIGVAPQPAKMANAVQDTASSTVRAALAQYARRWMVPSSAIRELVASWLGYPPPSQQR
jgi:hypothetical protein